MIPRSFLPTALAAALGLLLCPVGTVPAAQRASPPPPREAGSALERAEQLTSQNKLEDALDAFAEAVEDDPHDSKAFLERAGVYLRLQLPTLAAEDYERAIQAAPKSDEPLLARGTNRYLDKHYAEAISDLDAAIRLNPERIELYHWRGCAHAQAEHYEQAIADFSEVIDRDPEKSGYNGMEYANRAVAHYSLGHVAEALKDYERAEAAGQHCAEQRGECLIKLRHWKDALKIYDEILGSSEDAAPEAGGMSRYDALRSRAEVRTGLKDFDGAESDITEAIALKPNDANAYGSAAWTRLFAGKLEEARAAALRGLELDGTQDWIRVNLAHIYLFDGHFEWARSVYLRLRDKSPLAGKSGAEVVREDYADLRAAGVEHADMAKIEALMQEQSPAKPTPTPTPQPSPE